MEKSERLENTELPKQYQLTVTDRELHVMLIALAIFNMIMQHNMDKLGWLIDAAWDKVNKNQFDIDDYKSLGIKVVRLHEECH